MSHTILEQAHKNLLKRQRESDGTRSRSTEGSINEAPSPPDHPQGTHVPKKHKPPVGAEELRGIISKIKRSFVTEVQHLVRKEVQELQAALIKELKQHAPSADQFAGLSATVDRVFETISTTTSFLKETTIGEVVMTEKQAPAPQAEEHDDVQNPDELLDIIEASGELEDETPPDAQTAEVEHRENGQAGPAPGEAIEELLDANLVEGSAENAGAAAEQEGEESTGGDAPSYAQAPLDPAADEVQDGGSGEPIQDNEPPVEPEETQKEDAEASQPPEAPIQGPSDGEEETADALEAAVETVEESDPFSQADTVEETDAVEEEAAEETPQEDSDPSPETDDDDSPAAELLDDVENAAIEEAEEIVEAAIDDLVTGEDTAEAGLIPELYDEAEGNAAEPDEEEPAEMVQDVVEQNEAASPIELLEESGPAAPTGQVDISRLENFVEEACSELRSISRQVRSELSEIPNKVSKLVAKQMSSSTQAGYLKAINISLSSLHEAVDNLDARAQVAELKEDLQTLNTKIDGLKERLPELDAQA